MRSRGWIPQSPQGESCTTVNSGLDTPILDHVSVQRRRLGRMWQFDDKVFKKVSSFVTLNTNFHLFVVLFLFLLLVSLFLSCLILHPAVIAVTIYRFPPLPSKKYKFFTSSIFIDPTNHIRVRVMNLGFSSFWLDLRPGNPTCSNDKICWGDRTSHDFNV